jgi:G3E family GTPase
MNNKIPVLLVTGFLGAGKTTFLNWLIQTHPDLKISLILNEFGDVKLESKFIEENLGGEVAELSNGCMCCVAKSDIPRVVDYILENSPLTQYIIIEASGLSDPDPIHDALRSSELKDKVGLESVLCIVDALNFEKTRGEHAIIMSQIGDADIVILSKVKEAGEETVDRVKMFIENIGIGTKVLLWDRDLDPSLFLSFSNTQSEIKEKEKPEDHEHHHLHEEYDEFWFKSEKSIDFIKFTEVMKSLPANVVRSKGYVNFGGKRVMIQYVANKLETFESEWNDESPHTAVLFLGKQLDEDSLVSRLKLCEIN